MDQLAGFTMRRFIRCAEDRMDALRSGDAARIDAAAGPYEAARTELLCLITRAEAAAPTSHGMT